PGSPLRATRSGRAATRPDCPQDHLRVLVWIAENEPRTYRQARWALQPKDWLRARLTGEVRAELGLPTGIPVAAGAADTAAAALGSGVGPGDIQLTVGTGAQVIRPLVAPVSRADAGVNLYRLATPSGWYHMGATISGGLSLNWVREIMNASWEELYASADHPGQPHDPIFVPHLSGERTPYSDPTLRGSWTVLSLADDRTSLLRSALEGT